MECPLTGRILKLIPQRNYSAGASASIEHSVSFAKRPDVAIEVIDPSGEKELWIFDPKYKLRGSTLGAAESSEDDVEGTDAAASAIPKQVDIDAMHAYRDAIRGPGGGHVVRYAAILYPGPSQNYGDGLGALHADPADQAVLQLELEGVIARCFGTPVAALTVAA
jgi:predicted component of viral defense system (DUF524 family)